MCLPSINQSRGHGYQSHCSFCGHHVSRLGSEVKALCSLLCQRFDQDFNPHNDRQAQDRAYRIGQKRDVDVVKLISRGTIEEDMLRLGETKLALDEAVAGEGEEKGESAPEREMKMSLMNSLRQQFEKQEGGDSGSSNLTSSTATPAA